MFDFVTTLRLFVESETTHLIGRESNDLSWVHGLRLPDDVQMFFRSFSGGSFVWGVHLFELRRDPFEQTVNEIYALASIEVDLPAEAHHAYDECFLFASAKFPDAPSLHLGINLAASFFGWVFLYQDDELRCRLSPAATYIATDWCGFINTAHSNPKTFRGKPLWAPCHSVLGEHSENGWYEPN